MKKFKMLKWVIISASIFAVIIMIIVGVIQILDNVGLLPIDSMGSGSMQNVSAAVTTGDFVQYYQGDYGDVSYGGGTVAGKGCGPTSFAMVATKLTGRQITPKDVIDWCGNTYYVSGQGTSWAFFEAAAKHFNLNCTVKQTGSIDEAVTALQNGHLVISSQGPGLFTSHGHFIVLASIDSNGGISVKDPNKKNAVGKGYNNRTFTKAEISKAGKQYWIFE